MRWPYESASRFAGINFVMSCTDCHEAHGSNRGSMVRERLNVTGSGDCGTGGNPNPDGENCADGGNWNSFCGICHYYYGGQHAGMSCGNASCHEANSLHRIIHNTGSNATYLWSEPSRPTTTPEIESVEGAAGSDVLTVVFTRGVYAARGAAGALEPDDFLLTDAGGNNPRAIIAVDHVPGDSVAVLTMSAPLVSGDLFTDFVATTGVSVWDAADNPAGPWPHVIPSGCPLGTVTFAFGEPVGSATVSDATRLLVGTVNDPAQSLPGDGAFHGDGVNNYAVFTNMTCLQADRALTLETRLRPNVVDDGTAATIRRVFARDSNQNYQMSVWRSEADTWLPTFHPPDGVAVIAFWASPVDKHGGLTWKVAQTDYDACPIVANHWYVVRLVWNSDKIGGIPADFFVDDQGTDGSGLGENWPGTRNCTDADQSQVPESNRMWEGDEIVPADGNFVIGANVNNQANNLFDGLIDWIAWEPVADYPTAFGY
jgi:hypothetical protein